MLNRFLFFLSLLSGGLWATAYSQTFNFQLIGNPVNTTGWELGTSSSVSNDEIVLTQAIGGQAGYIYYQTPQNLANCSQFTVTFQFQITNSSNPTADGIAFWYISNPPSNFVGGGSIGLPNDPNGLLLILDTYNNDGYPDNNPLVSLRRLNGTSNYVEGSSTGQLCSDLTYQSFITDGNWHTCELKYYFGTVTVSFDGNPPVMTGTTTLNINGYFGFSAGTGALWSKQAIKNVHIMGAPEPNAPTTDTTYYCQFAPADTLTAQPDSNLLWYTTPVGGTPLPGAPTPSTTVPDTLTWYVSQEVPGCNIESNRAPVVVIVHPLPKPPTITIPVYCTGQLSSAIQTPPGSDVKWYANDTGGIGQSTPPQISTNSADTLTWYFTETDNYGCESPRDSVNIIVHQSPVADFSYNLGLACTGDTVHFHNETTYANQYLWNFGTNNFTDTSLNTSFVYPNAGNYFVTLTAQNTFCKDSTIKEITLGHPVIAAFRVSKDTVCQGTPINFFNQSTATTVNGIPPAYQWNFGDGSGSSSSLNSSYTYNHPGVYNAKLIVNNSIPCYDSTTRLIYVDSLSGVSVTVSDTPICKGAEITFTGNYTTIGLVHSVWRFGDSPDSVLDVNPATHSYETPGIYTVSLQNNYRVCPDTATTFQVKVKDVPYINIGQDSSLCLDGNPLILTDVTNENNPAASWLWNTGETTPSITVLHPGHYWAKVTIDNCSTKDDVTIAKGCYIDIPNSFTPNGDGINDYFFPRQFLSKDVTAFKMSIYNRWGEKIFETESKSGRGWDGRFNGKDQPVGVYIYIIDVTYQNGRNDSYKGNLTLLR